MFDARTVMCLSDYGRRELNPKWVSLVASFAPYRAAKVGVCRKQFSGWTGENGHKFNRATLCQQRDVCPVCSMVYTSILTSDAVELASKIAFATGGRIGFVSADFTLPGKAQAKVNEVDLSKLRKMCWKVLQEVLGAYDEGGKETRLIAGVGASQYWHTANPWKGWFPHFHFTVLDLYYDKREEAFGRSQLFLDSENLRKLRELWRSRFEESYGKTMAKCFVVHWRYSYGHGRLKHRLAYAFRRSVSDCYKMSYRSDLSEGLNRDWMERLLSPPKNEKRIQWYGWLSDGVKAKFLEKLDITVEKKTVRDRERRKVPCPICGSELYCYRYGVDYDSLSRENESVVLAFRRAKEARR